MKANIIHKDWNTGRKIKLRAFLRAAAMSSLMALQLRFSFSNTELGFFRNGQKACVTFISITTKFQSLDGIGVTQQHI